MSNKTNQTIDNIHEKSAEPYLAAEKIRNPTKTKRAEKAILSDVELVKRLNGLAQGSLFSSYYKEKDNDPL